MVSDIVVQAAAYKCPSGTTIEKLVQRPISVLARNYALGVLVLVYTLNFVDRQILSILLPAIKAEFGVGDWVLGFLAGPAFAIFYATLGLPIATLADRYNRRNLIAAAVAVWSAMTALSGLVTNVFQLALARIGVGVGEAGCSPPAVSMIADYYPPAQRSTAMGVYTLGISLGIMIAFLAGGWVAQNIGWRAAFFMVGLPGVLLALVVRFTIPEPMRGASEQRQDTQQRPKMRQVGAFLFRRPAFVHLAVGSGLAAFGGYTSIIFFPTFMVRSFELPVAQVGLYLGLIYGFGAGLGYVGGGYIADRLGRKSMKLSLQGVASLLMVAWIFSIPVFLMFDYRWALAIYIVPVVLSNVYLPTTYAQVQNLVPLRMRAVASAFVLLILNIIGLGIGPQVTGIMSDLLEPSVGFESMRYSLLAVAAVTIPWSAFHYYRASVHIERDLSRVDAS